MQERGRRGNLVHFSKSAPAFVGGFDADSQTAEAVAFFKESGFCVFRDFMDATAVAEVKDNLVRYQTEVAPNIDPRDAFAPPVANGAYSLLGRMDHYDSYFRNLARSERFTRLASLLLEQDVAPVHIQYFNIIPRIGQPTPPHQDARNLQLRYGHMVNFWLPLTAVDQVNGCLHYIPGSHLQGKRPHKYEYGDRGPILIDGYGDEDRAREVSLHVAPGDLLVHHGLTIHCSEENNSTLERCALGFPFVAKSDQRISVEEWDAPFREGRS